MNPEELIRRTREKIGSNPDTRRLNYESKLLKSAHDAYDDTKKARRRLYDFWSSIPDFYPKPPKEFNSRHRSSLLLPVGAGLLEAEVYGRSAERQFFVSILNLSESPDAEGKHGFPRKICLQFYAAVTENEKDLPEFRFAKTEEAMSTDWSSTSKAKCIFVDGEEFEAERVLLVNSGQYFDLSLPTGIDRSEIYRRTEAVNVDVGKMMGTLDLLNSGGFNADFMQQG